VDGRHVADQYDGTQCHQPARHAAGGIRNLPGVAVIGGGMIVEARGSLLGAVGVSGAPGGDADEAYAKAGLNMVRDKLEF
jgi:uncharacterized protein GlcG (DUF336 family)